MTWYFNDHRCIIFCTSKSDRMDTRAVADMCFYAVRGLSSTCELWAGMANSVPPSPARISLSRARPQLREDEWPTTPRGQYLEGRKQQLHMWLCRAARSRRETIVCRGGSWRPRRECSQEFQQDTRGQSSNTCCHRGWSSLRTYRNR